MLPNRSCIMGIIDKKKLVSSFMGFAFISIPFHSHAVQFEVGESSLNVYGYAKLDAIYDVDNKLGNSVNRASPRLDKAEGSDGHFDMHAFETRLGFTTETPVAGSILKTNIEGDFYGGGGGELRLRHGYGSWNGILAGQTWTNFTGLISGSPTIDFTGTGGNQVTNRQAQLRYTLDNFSLSLEDPDSLGAQVDGLGAKSQVPDFIARYTDRSGNIIYSISSVLRYLEYDNSGLSSPSSDDSSTGWGVGFEVSSDVTDNLTLRGGITHGDGIGGYLNGNPVSNPAYVDSNGDLNTIKATGGTVGASIKSGPGSFNLAYTVVDASLDDDFFNGDGTVSDPGHNESYEQAWMNYMWSPANNISYGIEASWHSRETAGGFEGDATRIQGMVKYSF